MAIEVKVVEDKKDKMKIEVSGRNHLTLANMLNENMWQQKGVESACAQKHPQIPVSEIVVHSASPKAKLLHAAEQLEKDAESLLKQLK